MGVDSERLKHELERATKRNRISCAAALATAFRCGITPAEVGRALDEAEIRIELCQLGLFGFGSGGEKQLLIPDTIPAGVETWIRGCVEAKGHVTCAEIFAKGKAECLARALLAGACETLGVKIRSCQLGAF